MKKLLFSLLMFSTSSFAQTSTKLELSCFPLKDIILEVEKYGEVPLLLANSVREDNNKASNHSIIFLVNPETRSWTLLEKSKNENYCILAIGNYIAPVIKGKTL
jgi:hypothetical protein